MYMITVDISLFPRKITHNFDLNRLFIIVQKMDWYNNPVVWIKEITKDTKISEYNNIAYITQVKWEKVYMEKMKNIRFYYSYS